PTRRSSDLIGVIYILCVCVSYTQGTACVDRPLLFGWAVKRSGLSLSLSFSLSLSLSLSFFLSLSLSLSLPLSHHMFLSSRNSTCHFSLRTSVTIPLDMYMYSICICIGTV